MVPNARFNELLQDIEPSATTTANASRAQNGIRTHLSAQADFKDRYVTSFLSGSYARKTSIRPRTSVSGEERADVDIIVVADFSETDDPDAVLKTVRRALEDSGHGYTVERTNKRSVRVETSLADMDIVPVIEIPGGYLIADRDTGAWKYTNPPVHDSWSVERNDHFDGRFKRLVKLLKWWRRMNPTGKRPKGFVLEVLVDLHAPVGVTHYGEAFTQLLESIYETYGPDASFDAKPFIEDPADPSNDILAKVTIAQWKDFIEKVRVYAGIARRAQDADDMEEATRQWQRVFGERFRSTSTPAKAATLGGFASAPATTAAEYRFPDTPAAPKKPRGFA